MKREKIVLYNPTAGFYTMPLALMALGSNLDRSRYDIRIVDARLEADPLGRLRSELRDALCLGVTVLTGEPIRDALRASRAAKEVRSDLPVIWGGWHPSLFATECLDEPSIDVTVQGQGEQTFVEIVERLSAGEDLLGVHGTTYREGGRSLQNLSRAMIDMNALPAHDYGLIDVEGYFKLKGKRQLDYISSTGCFFRCAFCADPFVYKRKWSGIDPERMGEELESAWKRYRFDEVAFQDETFFTYSDRVVSFAEEILVRGLRFSWTGTIRADQACRISDDMFALCVRSGLRWVMIGVEAGSQEMLDWMEKDITVEQILESAEKCRRHGVKAVFPIITGFPGETDESIIATLAMAKRLRAMDPKFETPIFYFKPYPGSRITDEAVRAGHKLPQTLEEWADFDFVDGSSGPWVSDERYRMIERFKFYNRHAGGIRTPARWPLQTISRWRVDHDYYGFPLEKAIVDRLKPLVTMS